MSYKTLLTKFVTLFIWPIEILLGFEGFMYLHKIFRNFYTTLAPNKYRRVRTKKDMEIKTRENPIVTKLETAEFKNIFTEEVIDLKKLFDKYNYEIRIAGGAVRDLLMGKQPKDLDFATVATPDQMKEMFTKEEIRLINEAGEKHGTITPRINDKENFEVTTLRIDVVTDGRRAEVEYTTDWKMDANRRDLTINSMFLGFDGSVYDYFFGFEDLKNHRVAFVGDPDIRIKEDYLRIMRYFRFYGRIAQKADNHEEETLKIISDNVEGLTIVSGERIWMELKKTLEGNYAGDLLKVMLRVGVGKFVGLPQNPNTEELERIIKLSENINLHPVSYLIALIKDIEEINTLHARLKLSNLDRDLAFFLLEMRDVIGDPERPLLPFEKVVLNRNMKRTIAIDYICEVLRYKGDIALLEQFKQWEIPTFPVNGKILKEKGLPPGKLYGRIVSKLKEEWIESNYKLNEGDLLKQLPEIIESFESKK